jgi:SET domain-containing protein
LQTEKCGHGLVAEDEIKKGEFVIEYVGEGMVLFKCTVSM